MIHCAGRFAYINFETLLKLPKQVFFLYEFYFIDNESMARAEE